MGRSWGRRMNDSLVLNTVQSASWVPRRLTSPWPVGCRGRGANPIAHVLAAIEEDLDLIQYNRWNVVLPEGTFLTEVRLSVALLVPSI